jgi:hypothetical protein
MIAARLSLLVALSCIGCSARIQHGRDDAGVADTQVESPPPAPSRCGEVGRACSAFASCCSGICTGGKCAGPEACSAEPRVIASIPRDASGDVAQSATRIFYLRGGEVWTVAKNGGAPVLYERAPKGPAIQGIATDGGSLYWTTAGGGVVIAPFDGGESVVARDQPWVLSSSESVVSNPFVFGGNVHWYVNYWETPPDPFDEHRLMTVSTSARDDEDPPFDATGGASIRVTGEARWLFWLDGGSPAVSALSYLVHFRERLGIHGNYFKPEMWVSPGPILAAEGGVYYFYRGDTWFGRPDPDGVATLIGPRSAASSEAFTAHGAWLYLPTVTDGVWRMHKADDTHERLTALDAFTIRSLVSDDTCLYAIGNDGKDANDVVIRMAIPAD